MFKNRGTNFAIPVLIKPRNRISKSTVGSQDVPKQCLKVKIHRSWNLIEDHGLIAIVQNPVLQMPADCTGKNQFFKVPPLLDEIAEDRGDDSPG